MANTPTESLAAALALLQTRLPKVGKDKKATVKSDKGQYSYQYADLADISDALLPLLGGLGLSWTACPTMLDDGKVVLEYALLHTSGEERGGRYPLPSSGTPQAMGSAITYARRYTLCSVTGLAPDADDDGAAAAAQRAEQPGPDQRPAAAQRAARPRREQSEVDKLREEIKALAAAQTPPWVLETIAQGYAAEYGGSLKTETDPDPIRLFLANLRAEAELAESEQGAA